MVALVIPISNQFILIEVAEAFAYESKGRPSLRGRLLLFHAIVRPHSLYDSDSSSNDDGDDDNL